MAEIAVAVAPAFVAFVVAVLALGGAALVIIGLANLGEAEHRMRHHQRAGGDRYQPRPAREPCPNGLARLAAHGQARRREARARRRARLDNPAE